MQEAAVPLATVVVDVTGFTFADSTVLCALLAFQRCQSLARPARSFQRTLELAGADQVPTSGRPWAMGSLLKRALCAASPLPAARSGSHRARRRRVPSVEGVQGLGEGGVAGVEVGAHAGEGRDEFGGVGGAEGGVQGGLGGARLGCEGAERADLSGEAAQVGCVVAGPGG